MTVERDIAGFALPFAAGIMAVSFFGTAHSWYLTPVSILVPAVAAVLLMSPAHKSWNTGILTGLILLAALGCGYLVGATRLEISVGITPENSIPERILQLGHGMKSRIEAIPFSHHDTGSIIAALITGNRTGIPHDVTRAFRESGAAHILALSGFHLGIIYGALSFMLSFIGNTPAARKLRSVLIIAICGMYTAATGAGASITRAFLFILLGETASIMGRHRCTSTILLSSLFLQLLLSPESSRDIGFQLSYAAMAGIAFIFPWMKGLWPDGKGGIMKRIWNSASISVSCQITTGPLAWMYFGTFPQYFLLTNLLALPLVGVLIPLSLLTMGLDAAGICPQLLIQVVEGLTSCMTFILEAIASL